ncbi:MAG: succinate dehydrogenase hydrophobic membrane anchor subunit [Micrococcaceae bacterium]
MTDKSLNVTSIPNPRTPERYRRTKKTKGSSQRNAWLFMRISGVALIVLIFAHLFTNLMVGKGIQAIDFGFVAGKWAHPLWKVWDLLMLWLAMLHGTNGVTTIINDYVTKPGANKALKMTLHIAAAVIIILGSLVIFTFDPCPKNADPALLASFCSK